ncbi:MAG: hypothetical protein JO296_02270 [Pseudonocardiales bacterium]|jgi:hypothetical protein|nr:hypothetical protein [Pseudonocardiales bacterium]MBV9648948.1 hypothetical protein [Pseudonocardiales bacterium]
MTQQTRGPVGPTRNPGGWKARFATSEAAEGWEETRAAPGKSAGSADNWEADKYVLEQWQYEVTSEGPIWYCPDPDKRIT